MSKVGTLRSAIKVTPPSGRTLEAQVSLLKNKEPLNLNRAERRFKEKFDRSNKK